MDRVPVQRVKHLSDRLRTDFIESFVTFLALGTHLSLALGGAGGCRRKLSTGRTCRLAPLTACCLP
jgi:hypothetical protein